jgi:hypothetical protein
METRWCSVACPWACAWCKHVFIHTHGSLGKGPLRRAGRGLNDVFCEIDCLPSPHGSMANGTCPPHAPESSPTWSCVTRHASSMRGRCYGSTAGRGLLKSVSSARLAARFRPLACVRGHADACPLNPALTHTTCLWVQVVRCERQTELFIERCFVGGWSDTERERHTLCTTYKRKHTNNTLGHNMDALLRYIIMYIYTQRERKDTERHIHREKERTIMCVCVCVCVRARVCVCVIALLYCCDYRLQH